MTMSITRYPSFRISLEDSCNASDIQTSLVEYIIDDVRLTKPLELWGPAGRLEALLMVPKTLPVAAAVVCHAHPLYGGTMHMKVVYRAAKALQQHGIAVLRFNFRGVGLSQGEHDGGHGEQDDVRVALDEMAARFPNLPLLLGGFSFGSHMTLLMGTKDSRIESLFAMGFPVSLIPDLSWLKQQRKPTFFVQCDGDPFGSGDQMREMLADLPEPHTLVVLPGGDHLFTDRLDELESALGKWVSGMPWQEE
jgi:alpha/beta superfamily hydrolase